MTTNTLIIGGGVVALPSLKTMIIYMALFGFSVACLALGLTARQADARKPLFLLGLLGLLGLGVAVLLTALS